MALEMIYLKLLVLGLKIHISISSARIVLDSLLQRYRIGTMISVRTVRKCIRLITKLKMLRFKYQIIKDRLIGIEWYLNVARQILLYILLIIQSCFPKAVVARTKLT